MTAGGKVGAVFDSLGRYAARRPLLVSGLCVTVTALCASGIARVVIETSPQAIWVPPGSTTSREKVYFDQHFHPFFRIEQLYFLAAEPDRNMIEKPFLQKVLAVQKEIESSTVQLRARNVTLADLCFRPIGGKGCLIESTGQYWRMDHTLVCNDPSVSLTAACQTTDEYLKTLSPCLDQIGTPVMRNVVLGGIGTDLQVQSPDPCGNSVPTAKALVITMLLNNYDDQAYIEAAQAWEKDVFLSIAESTKAKFINDVQTPMTVHYLSERSVEDSLQEETSQNTWVVAVSYLCMLVYIAVALGTFPDMVRSRFLLGLLGIVIVVSSLAISLGLCALFGMHTTLIIWEVLPFLILAIGVDNMFIISREFDRLRRKAGADKSQSLEDIAGATLAEVGPSILAAATSECAAFSAGTLTAIPALQQFCTVATVAVFADFLLQIMWFVAGLVLDARRVDAGRLDAVPCLRRPRRKEGLPAGVDHQRKGTEDAGLVSRFIDRYYIPALFTTPGKVIVVLLHLVFFVLGVVALTSLEMGLEPQLAAPTNSYLVDYYNTEFRLGEAGPPAYVVLKDLDYADSSVRQAVREVSTGLSSLKSYVQPPIYSWMDSVDAYLNAFASDTSLPSDCIVPDLAGLGYYGVVRQFLKISIDSQCCQSAGICGEQYQPDVVFEDTSVSARISASRLRFQLQPLRHEKDFIESYSLLRQAVAQLADRIPERYPGQRRQGGTSNVAFPYSLYFVFYEQYTYIEGVAIADVLLALAAVFLCTAVLTSPATAAVIVAVVASIVINMIGVLFVWNRGQRAGFGVRINAVSVVNLVMSVGLSVEFVVHIASAFLRARGSAEQRAKRALSCMGAAVVSGITLTKLVGVAILAVAPSHLFRVYYFRMYAALIAMGAFEGLALLPVAYSLLDAWPSARNKTREGGAYMPINES